MSVGRVGCCKNGTGPFGYTTYQEAIGNPRINYRTEFYHLFAQDDWKITARLKLNYGVRYDLYNVPRAFPDGLGAERACGYQ
ncbi:MAG: TonB-dependent receptor [Acidobacteriota bacterium]